MQFFLQLVGIGLVLVSLIDIFLTVLHPRAASYLFSIPFVKVMWSFFRWGARRLPKQRDRILSYGGAIILVAMVWIWASLLLVGFALIVWPGLGTAIQTNQGETPTDFVTALYYAGFSLSTLGTGDLSPQTASYRGLMVLKSFLGFSVVTLVLSYVLAVYNALNSRNTFALSLHHRTANTSDSVALLARLAAGNSLSTFHQNISDIAQKLISLSELNNSYPLLLYFRYHQAYYALAKIVYLVLDTATLTQSALDKDYYGPITASSGIAEVWYGGLHLLDSLNHEIKLSKKKSSQELSESFWKDHYYQALDQLKIQGIKTVSDPESGANAYISLRRQWATSLARLIAYTDYRPSQIYK